MGHCSFLPLFLFTNCIQLKKRMEEVKNMNKLSDLKQAPINFIELDKERPLTFDFNALCILQDEGYSDPFVAVSGITNGDVQSVRALLYASLVAGQLAMNEDEPFELSLNKVGRLLGIAMQNEDLYGEILETILLGVGSFFPKKEDKEETIEENEEDPKN